MSSEKHLKSDESKSVAVVPQLQLLLFTDERISHRADIKQVRDHLANLEQDYDFSLEVIDIKEQPQLVELYRLVATPSLVKVFPKPMQVFAGSSILPDLKRWWGQWQEALDDLKQNYDEFSEQTARTELDAERRSHSADVMRLSDEIFQLQREKEELAKQIEFKDQILAMLAHDLRSPLTGTSIALETLEIIAQRPETAKTSDLKHQLYQQAKNQLQIMNRMITELLDESRQLSTKLDIKPHRMNLNDLCKDVLVQMNTRFQRRSIQLTVDMPSDLPEVYGDAELLRQVLVNLLDNAIKYSSVNGEVKLVGLHRTLQKVQVSIIDHGHGIPEDEQEKIFEGHFRLKRDSTKEGYGLGLAVCRRIIQAHHGQIWVDSTLGKGSEFHFTLPVCVDRPSK